MLPLEAIGARESCCICVLRYDNHGGETLDLIREMEAAGLIKRHLPIIAVTANARSEQVLMA